MGLLDIIRKPKPSPEVCKPQPPVEPSTHLSSTEEFMTAALLMADLPLPPAKVDRARELASSLAVSAYRRIYSDSSGELGASPEMADTLIVDIYRQIGCAFRAVARERGEFIESGVLNKIVLYLLDFYRVDGRDFYEDHLQYEIQKYRREGLRADYSEKPLHLFRHPDDVVSGS